MVRERVISGVIITVILIILAFVGGLPLCITFGFCGCVGYYELLKAVGSLRTGESMNLPAAIGLIYAVILYAALYFVSVLSEDSVQVFAACTVILVIMAAQFLTEMAVFVINYPEFEAKQMIGTVFSFIYAPVLMSLVFLSRLLPYGLVVYALIFFCSSICDVCAWAVGRKIGKHRLAPILSPKKSIEGAVGGVIGSMIVCFITAIVVAIVVPGEKLFIQFLILGFAGSIISQIGDLSASGIKRAVGLKDYGRLIPGHGGIMDRFDSVIFTAPVIYFLSVLFLVVLR